jgi:hypothetical protein
VDKISRYGFPNSVGEILEDTMMVGTLSLGGILYKCPDLKVCIAHGGGPAYFGWDVWTVVGRYAQKPG